MRQTFKQDEAEQILKKAMARAAGEVGTGSCEVSQERMEAMAAELGVDPATVAAAAAEYRAEQTEQQERREFIARRRGEFREHLISYIGVNIFLLAINLLTSPKYLWVIWPVLGWGLGLFFLAWASLRTSGPSFEEEFAKWRKKQRKKTKRTDENE